MGTMKRVRLIAIPTLAFLFNSAALAQQTLEERGYQAVEPMVQDRDPLAGGLRRLEAGLRSQGGQGSYVYRQKGGAPGQEKLFFIAPGIVAQFERSDYKLFEVQKDTYQVLPVIPANTVFHIGQPPAAPSSEPVPLSPIARQLRVDTRVDARVHQDWREETQDENDLSRGKWRRYIAYSEQRQKAVLDTLGKLGDATDVAPSASSARRD